MTPAFDLDLQGVLVDVGDAVALAVVALVVGLAGGAAVLLRLLFGLQALGAGEQAAEGDAAVEELGVVGAEVDLGAFRLLAAQAEVGFEQALDGGRAGRTLEAGARFCT